jgi:hypothetical protein
VVLSVIDQSDRSVLGAALDTRHNARRHGLVAALGAADLPRERPNKALEPGAGVLESSEGIRGDPGQTTNRFIVIRCSSRILGADAE